jgi:cell surface protein SprA
LDKNFTARVFVWLFVLSAFCGIRTAFAQKRPSNSKDSLIISVPYKGQKSKNNKLREGRFEVDPPNLERTIQYDAAANRYVLIEKVGNLLYRAPRYLAFSEFLQLTQQQNRREYFKQLTDNYAYQSQQPGFIPQIKIRSRTFEQIFGSNVIDIRPQGSAQLVFAGQVNSNQNPLFNTRQRKQFNFNFDQRIQMNITGSVGDKLKIATNYNTDAQFQFENQVKLDYTGRPDEIIQKIEAGTVSMPLNTSLIRGSQALFGLKTRLKFGKLDVTSIFSQQRSQARTITITNGQQQGEFRLTPADYEANRHYFLGTYFRDNYNKALANIPLISTSVTVTRVEVWTTNRTNTTTDSRDIIGLLDLGENRPYNTTQVQGGPGFSVLPAGFQGPGFTQQSNSLVSRLFSLPNQGRLSNSNDVANLFQSSGATDNYAKLPYARKLTAREFTLHPQLGYISLNYPLNNDEVLAVAYRYSVNGVEYQVGEFSNDIPVDATNPKALYVKLLKNEILKTNLPTWDLMMKNIYSLGAYQVSPINFRLAIARLDDRTNIEKQNIDEGANITGKRWLQLTKLDTLNQQNDRLPQGDGYFDFLEGITIDSQNGRIMFPVVEPFGADLAARFRPTEQDLIRRYVYQPLYDSTRTIAQQFFPQLNRYIIKGTYSSQGGSEFQLNAVNIPQGSVVVNAGALRLQEGTDFTVDYSIGRIRIMNQSLLSSGQPLTVNIENNELFGVQQKTLYGSRFDYRANAKLALGATIMHLSEQPLTQKQIIGEESVSNTIMGFDVNYSSESRFLTRMVDRLPFINTKAPSFINFSGEFAQLMPGSPSSLNFAGSKKGTSYLDDFESSQSIIDLKSALSWQISGTPQLFNESRLFNDLSYGYNRARLAFYNIDPVFFNSGTFSLSRADLSNHYVRQVLETEVMPYKQSVTGQPLLLPTLDLAFYPNVRGQYNYSTTGINPDGTLQNPRTRWGGIFRKLETNDFESLNVQYMEFWMMDPFIYKPNSQGGDLYLNLGSLSEDILKDGRKSVENGLPPDGTTDATDETVWGRVPRLQPVINAFDNNPEARRLQDVGLDGLNDNGEQTKFQTFVQQVRTQLTPAAAAALTADPSSDNYQYYQGPQLDQNRVGILQRYSRYNGTEGNSKTAEQSQAELGISTSASTSLPDGEDLNRDNSTSQADEYFQYRVSVRPQDMVVGQNFINDKITSAVKLPDGTTQEVTWYQFRVPIAGYQSKAGNIQDFKAIRFMRMFMTNFADTAVLRMGTLQLVRGEWRTYNVENAASKVIADPLLVNPPIDGSTLNVQAVNIEANGNRTPIPYVVPPGIERQRDYNNLRTDTRLNEQSLSLKVLNLRNGYSRAAYRTFFNDLRAYKRLQMFVHAEGDLLNDNDLSAFIRLGVDYQDSYYEYEIPLKATRPGTVDPNAIWPEANNIDLELAALTRAKLVRDNAIANGQLTSINIPFTVIDGSSKITIKGQPDLSRLRAIMLGVRNPYKAAGGFDRSATVWFNELRLTEFDQRGGWAATARLNARLADFGDITMAGSKTTIGFGSIEQRVSERSRADSHTFDVAGSLELGKFFPAKTGMHIPMYVNLSQQVAMPQYNPAQPDVELKDALANAPTDEKRDEIKRTAQDYTMRKSINFTNVHKAKTNTAEPVKIWDVENFTGTYAYSEYEHHDFITENDLQKIYRVALAYNYLNPAKYYTPLEKVIKSNMLTLFRDINFSILPSRLNFAISFDRFYSENTLRNNDPENFLPVPTTNFNKNFNITRVYGIGWNLTKSLQMDIDATNLSVVDEAAGRLNGLKRDTLWENLKRLGRTTNYNHTINFNYTVPINKVPGLDWVTTVARYSTNFNWQTQPKFALDDAALNVGNTIQNSRSVQLNPTLNLTGLYNKFAALRKYNNADDKGTNKAAKFLVGLITSIKNLGATYTRSDGTYLPGYLPTTSFAGQDLDFNAPGIGFLLGSQTDIRAKAVANGWLSTNALQNQLYTNTLSEDLHLRSTIRPIPDLNIELTAFRTQDRNFQTNLKYNEATGGFENQSPITSGNYSVSYLSLGTAFSKDRGINNYSSTFQALLNNRQVISQRLGQQNTNSAGAAAGGYRDGYGPNQQDVLVNSFLAAYAGKDPRNTKLNSFPQIPVPNWQLTYNGLSRVGFLKEFFDSFDIRHGYRSTYNVNSYNSLIRYREIDGGPAERDVNADFLPFYQFTQVTLFEQFVPLVGVDVRFKNSMTVNAEYRKSRTLSLSLLNSQLAQQNENIMVFGFGYRTNNFHFPFGLFSNFKLKNDVNFKMDFALRDNKIVIYRADVQTAEISSGAKNITIRPSIDYVINQRFNFNLFYDSNITKPYTSQTFNTAFTNFGVNLKLMLQ